MDIKQFRHFVAVAEELHVRRAAERLNIAQSALSQGIQQLELELGVSLFRREKRRLTLTPTGQLFLREVRLALQQAAHAIAVARRSESGEIGKVTIGYVDSAMLGATMRGMLSGFKAAYPLVELVLRGCNVIDQFAFLNDGQLDTGVVRGPLPVMSGGLRSELIEQEALVVCLPAGHALTDRSVILAGDLRDDGFVMPLDPPGIGLAGQIGLIAQSADFQPRVSQHASQTTTAACLVAAGFGVAILPASLMELHLSGVVFRPLAPPVLTSLHLLSRADERRPVVASFLASVRRHVRANDASFPAA